MKAKIRLSVCLLLVTAQLVSCASVGRLFATPTPLPSLTPTATPVPTPTQTPTPFPFYGRQVPDVTYCTVDGLPQKMDLYFPPGGGPWPVVVYIHGGSWMSVDKTEGAPAAGLLNPLGYLVVSIDYRLYPQARFPALIEDPKCAIRSLRAHAAELNLDPARIAAMGTSAGGHLAALLGTSDAHAGWDVGEYPEQSSRVQAVIDLSGLADLTRDFPDTALKRAIIAAFDPDPALLVRASPVTYATADDPPFLILHGDRDPLVPVEQAHLMHAALVDAGVSARLVIVENGLHNLSVPNATSPSQAEIGLLIARFLAEMLAGR